MSESITPPVVPIDEPERLTRSQILDQYWPAFFSFQLQEYEKRKKSGWGVAKGLFTEAEFWEYMIASKPEVIQEMLGPLAS